VSAETIVGIVLFLLIVAKGVLAFVVLGGVLEEGYRREMRAHGFRPGPLPWWTRKLPSPRTWLRRRLSSIRRRVFRRRAC
jgi:hypothetical protein